MKPMSMEKRAMLNSFNEKQSDWYGKCRRCGKELSGTPQMIKDHKCDAHTSTDSTSPS